jgi:4-amino-4-deoxy-L-arabinose transferase-like glycosyltransferase
LLLLRGAVVLLLPALLFLIWNHHADQLKAANEIAAMTRSGAPGIMKWTFGTIDQRFGSEMLRAQARAMLDLFGLGWPALLLLVAVLFVRARPAAQDRNRTWILLLLYVFPWMVFTNLHIKHDYYQTAIGLFAIAAVANTLAVIAARQGRMIAILVCGALVASQVARIATHHFLDPSATAERDLRIARILKAETGRDQLVMTYGHDWSPLIPYYAERKAAMEPSWTLPSEYRRRLPESSLDRKSPAGAVVRCPSQVDRDPFARRTFAALSKNSRVTRVGDCELYLQPRPSGQLVKAPVS